MSLTESHLNDEEGRVLALERYEVLDTDEGEKPFEHVATLVRQTLNVPMSAVSLVDRHRQWFKARRGLGVRETPRDISFCTHAIQQTDAFVVTDAAEHPLFKENPLVVGDPYIRSYLGIPLRTPDGYNIGSLCGIDTKPNDFQPQQVEIMKSFARIIIDELELRQIASSDALTGAMTRRAWSEAAEQEIKRTDRYKSQASVVILDIDKFKSVNDTYGHPAGDRVIKLLADICINAHRDTDCFGRFGGEEFVLLLPETSGKDALSLIDRLREEFQASEVPVDNGAVIQCTFSAGITEVTVGDQLDHVLARADRCLYEAKKAGRNRAVLDRDFDISQANG